jgi:nucleolar complex protein 3
MGKRNRRSEEKRKQAQQEKDKLLSSGVFTGNSHENLTDNEEDWNNEEQDYELQPRAIKKQKVVEGLPIKRADGKVERVIRVEEENDEPEEESEAEPEVEQELESPGEQQQEEEEEDEDAHLSPKERLIKIKEEIADLASKLIEDPEENISCLTRLRKMSESKNVITCQLSIMALVPVFKSLAPSYRIRQLTEAEAREKVSREVQKLRQFEQGLVTNYMAYVDNLTKISKTSFSNSQNNKSIGEDQINSGILAAKAASELATALRHFNYRKEVFTIIIRRLNKRPNNDKDLPVFQKCIRVLETLLVEDEEHGDITMDIVTIMSKSIRDKKYRVDESVINILLSLSLLHDYDPNNNKDEVTKPKLKKKDRVHLSKKERKARKERKEIEEELQQAQQAITVEQREKYQGQVLKMVLKLYLEILREGTHTSENKNDAGQLMAAVLEGLSKFGQMANFDLLGDFLEVLREIMLDIVEEHKIEGMYDGKQLRTILLCIATSFTLVLNHSALGKISMDLSKFVNVLYTIVAELSLDCDLEFSHKTLRIADPLTLELEKPSVNVSTKSELLLRCLDNIFFRSRNGTASRATAFIKRLYIASLNMPEKTSLATLKFIGKLMARYDEVKGLWNTEERINGEGTYILGLERLDREVELERCNAGAATLWENVLLDKHYNPMVRDGSRSLMKNSKERK